MIFLEKYRLEGLVFLIIILSLLAFLVLSINEKDFLLHFTFKKLSDFLWSAEF